MQCCSLCTYVCCDSVEIYISAKYFLNFIQRHLFSVDSKYIKENVSDTPETDLTNCAIHRSKKEKVRLRKYLSDDMDYFLFYFFRYQSHRSCQVKAEMYVQYFPQIFMLELVRILCLEYMNFLKPRLLFIQFRWLFFTR